jgi:hypothetical protein
MQFKDFLNSYLRYTPIIGALILFVFSLFFQPTHDWDLDAFLYLGSRLQDGRFIYVDDFETKLPFLQYLFSIPAYLGGIGAWRIISFVTALSLGLFATHLLFKDLAYKSKITTIKTKQLSIFITGLFLLLLYSLPGADSAHIEIFSSSFLYVAFVLLLIRHLDIAQSKKYIFFAGVFLAIAALVRPNYVYLFPLFAILAFVKDKQIRFQFFKLSFTLSFLAGFFIAIFLNFLPYIFIDHGLIALMNGLITMKNASHNYGLKHLLSEQMLHKSGIFYILMYLIIGLLLMNALTQTKHRKKLLHFLLPILITILLLNLSFLRNHYYAHNTILFVPIVCIGLSFLFFLKFKDIPFQINAFHILIFILTIFIVMRPLADIRKNMLSVANGEYAFNIQINHRNIHDPLLTFLLDQKHQGKSFLVADSAIYHMMLHEPRIGDGHPFMLEFVLGGGRLVSMENIYLFSNETAKEPCKVLNQSNKDFVIVKRGDKFYGYIDKCLAGDTSDYKKENIAHLEAFAVYRLKKL